MPPDLTPEQVAELDEATAPVDPDASAEPDAEASTNASPPADGEASPSDSAPADDEEGEPAAAATAKPETPEQKAEREKQEQIAKRWKLVEDAKKQHLAVARRERELTAERQRFDQEKQQLQVERQAHARTVQEAQRILDTIAHVRANPTIEGLRTLGFDYMQLTTEMVNANTPEAIARAAAEETRRLREQLDAQSRQQSQLQVDRQDAHRLVTMAEENEELFPDLVTFPPEWIAEEGIALRDRHRQETGRFPSYQWVVEKLQEKAKKIESARAAKRAGGAGTNSEKTQASTNGTGPRATGPTGKPTLGNAAATTRATPPREMTEEEKDAWALSQLRSLKQGAR